MLLKLLNRVRGANSVGLRRWVGHDEVRLASKRVRWVALGWFVVGRVGLVGGQVGSD